MARITSKKRKKVDPADDFRNLTPAERKKLLRTVSKGRAMLEEIIALSKGVIGPDKATTLADHAKRLDKLREMLIKSGRAAARRAAAHIKE